MRTVDSDGASERAIFVRGGPSSASVVMSAPPRRSYRNAYLNMSGQDVVYAILEVPASAWLAVG